MNTILPLASELKPVSIHAYVDKVVVWLRYRVNNAELAWLRRYCGRIRKSGVKTKGVYRINRRARFDWRYVQRLTFCQPQRRVLQWIAARSDGYINQVEVALDYIFKDWRQREWLYDFLSWHLVRNWHSKRQHIRVHPGAGETRYDGPRQAPNSIKLYKEMYSRITGELHPLHLEWRAFTGRAVRSLGIHSPADLLRFSHHRCWKKRLLLLDVAPERIGRLLRNRRRGGRERSYSREDRRDGNIVLRGVNSIQELIDECEGYFNFRRVLVPISNEGLLPERVVTTVTTESSKKGEKQGMASEDFIVRSRSLEASGQFSSLY